MGKALGKSSIFSFIPNELIKSGDVCCPSRVPVPLTGMHPFALGIMFQLSNRCRNVVDLRARNFEILGGLLPCGLRDESIFYEKDN